MSLIDYIEDIRKQADKLAEMASQLHEDIIASLAPDEADEDILDEDNPKIHDQDIPTEDTSREA